MEGELSGGETAVGTKDNLETEFNAGSESCTEKEELGNMKDHGKMECLMEKELNSLKMERNMRELSRKINSMEMVFSTKMILSFMECGKITICQL